MLSIHIDNIHKGKHGSDSESYDTEGRYVRFGTFSMSSSAQALSSGRLQILYCTITVTAIFNFANVLSLHRFDPSKFDAIFSKYGRTHPNALTRDELISMLEGNRNVYDFLGW